jgi:RNA polymerase sigma-70 factor (ECF subfamily)
MKENQQRLEFSDEELARRAAAGSHACFETLVFRYSARLFQFLRKRMPTDQDAEDIAQEAFIKAYRNLDRFDPSLKFSTWLYTIASRLAVSHYRSGRWKLENLTGPAEPGAVETVKTGAAGGPEAAMTERENMRNLWVTAQTLKKESYESLWLRYVEEMTIKEIAAVMKKSQIYVRVLLHRARLKLTRLVAEQVGQEQPQENYDVLFSL